MKVLELNINKTIISFNDENIIIDKNKIEVLEKIIEDIAIKNLVRNENI